MSDEERARTRCMLVDAEHRIIACSDESAALTGTFHLPEKRDNVGYYTDSSGRVVGYALTPGYETYQGLGWYGVIEQIPIHSG